MALNKVLGSFKPDNLLAANQELPAVADTLEIAAGQFLLRGSLVNKDGVLVDANDMEVYAVLARDCDTTDGAKEAPVYLTGEFNADAVKMNENVDNKFAVCVAARRAGIFLKPHVKMPPVAPMTLRFKFSKPGYVPSTEKGTWKNIVDGIWDWTYDNPDWSKAFHGAFPDEDNEVSVIAAGDTSSVESFRQMFSGIWTSSPTNTSYNPTLRNNIVSCVPFNIDSATELEALFCSTALRKYVQFDYSRNDGAEASCMFADTLIEKIGDVVLGVKTAGGLFTQNDKLKKIGNISFDSSKLDANTSINIIAFTSRNRYTNVLEEVGNITGTEYVKSFDTMFQSCYKLKKIGSIDCTSGESFQAMFSWCTSLEEVPTLIGIGSASITTIYQMFSSCKTIKVIPLFDTSKATSIRAAFRGCNSLTDIPNYNFDSVTDCREVFRDTFDVSTGITEAYNKLIARGVSLAQYSQAFENCGINTAEGRAALAQIPASWGGLAEG